MSFPTRILFMIGLLGLPGCSQNVDEPERERTTQQVKATPLVDKPVKLEELKGVFPGDALLLKDVNAFDFACTHNGAIVICNDDVYEEQPLDVFVYDMKTGTTRHTLRHDAFVIRAAVSPDQRKLATITVGRYAPLNLWDLESGELIRAFRIPPRNAELSASSGKREDTGVNLWTHPQNWRFAFTSIVPKDGFGFTAVAFSPDGSQLVTGEEGGRLVIWDVRTGTRLKSWLSGIRRPMGIRITPDGTRLLVAGMGDIIQLWDLESMSLIQQYDETRDRNWVHGYRPAADFSADGTRFVFYSPNQYALRICDSATGREQLRLPNDSRHENGLLEIPLERGLGFMDDDTTVFSHTGAMVKLWNAESGTLIQKFDCRTGVTADRGHSNVEYVKFLPASRAFLSAQIENDESTQHDTWINIRIMPLIVVQK